MTGFCTTWNGEGDATAGVRMAATDIEFHTDIDENGVELVSRLGPLARQKPPGWSTNKTQDWTSVTWFCGANTITEWRMQNTFMSCWKAAVWNARQQ